MAKNFKLFTIFSFLLLMTFCNEMHAKSNRVYSDAGMWTTLNLDFNINKKWTLLFTEEWRMRENYSRLNLFYTNIGAEYKVNKNLKTNLVYRWIDKFQDDNSFSFRHRLQWDVTYKQAVSKKIQLSYRHRLQTEYSDLFVKKGSFVPEWYSRNKIDFNYQINKKLDWYFSTEFRFQIHDKKSESSEHQWHRARFQSGFDYQINDLSKVGVYYLFQTEFNIVSPQKIFITGLEYSRKIQL